MTAAERLAAIRARVEAATPGPWAVMRDAEGRPWVGKADGPMVGDDPAQDDADATFQAHARDDVPFLLAEVQRRDDALAAVLALCDAGDEAAANATRAYPEGQPDPGPPPAWVWADEVRAAITDALGADR